ncbi:hypothetical protein AB0R12_39095 [Streptomyces niveus]|uniref:hypothetical protein n=1 Tax=Streptomyces niveus TaxID=193462 RepID=UPI003411FBB5
MQAEPWERSAADLAALMRRSFEATAAPAPALDVAPLGVPALPPRAGPGVPLLREG